MIEVGKNQSEKGGKHVLMAVLAHPDDETFAKYAHEGVDVYLVCATRGEVGEMEPQYLEGFKNPAERREYELRCAAKTLGLKEVIFLDYKDSGMTGSIHNQDPESLEAAPLEEVADKVKLYIDQLHPEVVLTFDPIGGYRHPDHIKIHNATVLAFQKCIDDFKNKKDSNSESTVPQKLYFHTIPKGFLKFSVALLKLVGRDPRKFGKNQDIDLESIIEVDFPINAVVNFSKYNSMRNNASACHASQGGTSTSGGIMGWLRRIFGSKDLFMRAYPEPKNGDFREYDLFAGIR
jgi:N-acetyl-1-D-myo-inositol-2-amino-2-deoxy-alpha-D-glucopyranoside deacetylase